MWCGGCETNPISGNATLRKSVEKEGAGVINRCVWVRRGRSSWQRHSRRGGSWRLPATAPPVRRALYSPAREARVCGEMDTTTTASGSHSLARSSRPLWCCSSTVSAEVTQPLHARQSCSETLTGPPSSSVYVCLKPPPPPLGVLLRAAWPSAARLLCSRTWPSACGGGVGAAQHACSDCMTPRGKR